METIYDRGRPPVVARRALVRYYEPRTGKRVFPRFPGGCGVRLHLVLLEYPEIDLQKPANIVSLENSEICDHSTKMVTEQETRKRMASATRGSEAESDSDGRAKAVAGGRKKSPGKRDVRKNHENTTSLTPKTITSTS